MTSPNYWSLHCNWALLRESDPALQPLSMTPSILGRLLQLMLHLHRWPLIRQNLSCVLWPFHAFKTSTAWEWLKCFQIWRPVQGRTLALYGPQILCQGRNSNSHITPTVKGVECTRDPMPSGMGHKWKPYPSLCHMAFTHTAQVAVLQSEPICLDS